VGSSRKRREGKATTSAAMETRFISYREGGRGGGRKGGRGKKGYGENEPWVLFYGT
jgi:ribosomal protein L15